MREKKTFLKPDCLIIQFNQDDVIATSNYDDFDPNHEDGENWNGNN